MTVMRCPSCHREYEQGFLKCPFDGASLVDAAAADSHDPLLGRQIAETYQIIRRIGAGGMGSVYECRHVRLETAFAIKFLRPELAINEEMLARFHREARAASQLRHPNIVEVIDVNRTPDHLHYIVQELLEGQPLSAALEQQGTLDVTLGVSIVAQVCDAMAAAHARQIVHRDLKPENIFLVSKNGQEIVKVLDFGIAKVQEKRTQLTQASQVMGTPDYISPEQASSAGEVDFHSDIYSLGVVVYRIFTGRLPYEIDNPAIALYSVREKDPVPPRERRPDLPPAIEAVMMRAMRRKPSERYGSMLEFKDALLGLLDQQQLAQVAVPATIRPTPVHALPTTPFSPPTGPGLPPTVASAAADQVTGPPSPASGFRSMKVDALRKTGGGPTPLPVGQVQPTTASQQQGQKLPLTAIIVGVVVLVVGGGGYLVYRVTRPPAADLLPAKPQHVVAPQRDARPSPVVAPPRADAAPRVASPAPDARAAGTKEPTTAGAPGMVLFKGGNFVMGRDDGSIWEKPAHGCSVDDFFLDEQEVTAGAFAAFLKTPTGQELAARAATWKGFAPTGDAAPLPVTMVSWAEAAAFCRAADKRLPTEKEFEYAARGASHDALYPTGKEPPGPAECNFSRGAPAALRPAGKPVDGLRDLLGNAAEWVADAASGYTRQCDKRKKPHPKMAKYRIIRGGGFDDTDAQRVTATYRIPQDPKTFRWKSVGFRCARDAR